jgi:uncharacterized protein YdeI (YjbR/CyaY-like superfamily)
MLEPKEVLDFLDRSAWRAWLEAYHDARTEAWVRHTEKGALLAGRMANDTRALAHG